MKNQRPKAKMIAQPKRAKPQMASANTFKNSGSKNIAGKKPGK